MFTWLKKLFTSRGKENKIETTKEEQKNTEEKQDSSTEAETKFPGVVVGEIIVVDAHPNADRLKLTKVNIGDKELDIVCGGPNVSVGQKVPVALVGSKLPNGMEIKEANIRGENSYGMICAEDELGLGSAHEEIIVLKPEAVIGEKIDLYL